MKLIEVEHFRIFLKHCELVGCILFIVCGCSIHFSKQWCLIDIRYLVKARDTQTSEKVAIVLLCK